MGGLMNHYARGDAEAARAVEVRYRGPVEQWARGMFPRAEDREDAVQEAFLKLWRQSARFDAKRGSEDSFVGVVCRRALLDARRGLGRGIKTEPLIAEAADGDAFTASAHQPDVHAENREDFGRVSDLLAESPKEDERIIRLSFLQGLSHREIAERLCRPLATVRTQARRALLRLRDRLSRPTEPTSQLELC